MTTEKKPPESANYLSDAPLRDSGGDAFGRAEYAKNLAAAISTMNADDGFVIGLNAPWGYGKTTLLNFVLNHIEANHKNDVAVVIRFNPWWFSGRENLLGSFFREFQAGLGLFKDFEKIAPLLGSFAAHLAADGVKMWLAASGLGALSSVADAGGKKLTESVQNRSQSVDAIRSKIVDHLRGQQKRIIIAIDDIDRLTAEEIREIFGLVKSVADFPRTIYLLCFDHGIVAKALDGIQGNAEQGDGYIGKIVQMPIELPEIDRHQLREFFGGELNTVISPLPKNFYPNDIPFWGKTPYLSDEDDLFTVRVGKSPRTSFLNTPRDVKQLLNAIRFVYPMVKGEVDAGDFIGIQTLRVFVPEIYQFIRSGVLLSPEFNEFAALNYKDKDSRQKQIGQALKTVPEKYHQAINALIQHLFPPKVGNDWREWRRRNRICIPECFDVYFKLEVPNYAISMAEMKSVLNCIGDADAFAECLSSIDQKPMSDGTTKLRRILDRILDYTDNEISPSHTKPMLTAIFRIADILIEKENVEILCGNDIYLERLYFELLRTISDSQERFDILRHAISASDAIWFIAREVMILGQQLGKYLPPNHSPSLDPLLSLEQQEALEKITLEKIRAATAAGNLHKRLRWGSLLHRLSDFGCEQDAKDYAIELIKSDEGFCDLLTVLVSWMREIPSGRTTAEINPQSVQKFLGERVKELPSRCEKILANNPPWLNEGQRRLALQTFLNAMRGKQPPTF